MDALLLDRFDWTRMPDVLRIATELEKVHILLSDPDSDPDECNDVPFAAALTRKLLGDPGRMQKLRRIASEFSLLVSG